MKILLVGSNGRMGQMVLQNAEKDDVVFGIDVDDDIKETKEKVDVIIDFSTCQNREDFFEFSDKNKVPYACFSTNVSEKEKNAFKRLSKKVPVLLCNNSSQGMNVIFEVVEMASKRLKADAVLTEYHHKSKKDNPSGSAKVLEEILKGTNTKYETIGFRVGSECGTHEIKFFMQDEVLEIRHVAHSRKIFALGALEMAKKLATKEKGFYTKL